MQPPRVRTGTKTAITIIALVALTLAVRAIDIDRPYETWDEVTTYAVGLNLWYNIFTGDFSPETWKTYQPDWSGSLHPPLARYAYGIVNGASLFFRAGPTLFSLSFDDAVATMFQLKSMVPGRVLSALFAAGTAAVLFLLVRRFFGDKTAALAAAIFALLPVSIAQTKLAALDAMLAFLYTVAVYLFVRGLDDRRYFFLSLIATGLAVATKYNAVTLFALLPAIYFLAGRPRAIPKKALLLLPVVAAAVLFLVWPRLWPDPVGGALANANGWLAMGGGSVGEYFLGQFEARHTPLYEITYVAATTPALLLLFFAVGIADSLKRRTFGDRALLLWFALPLAVYSLYQFKMNGPRYVFMIYPAIAALMAIGVFRVAEAATARARFGRALAIAIPLLTLASLVAVDASIHPYYLDYYNEFAGGPKAAYEQNLFVIGRFGEGIDDAAYWLNAHAEPNATVQFFVMPRHVIPPLRGDLVDLTPFVPRYLTEDRVENKNWDLTGVPPAAAYVVENTFFRRYLNSTFHGLIGPDYRLIHTIDVQGGQLAWIYKRAG